MIASPAAPPAALSLSSSPHPAMASIATVMAAATYLLGTMLLSSLDERGRMLSLTFAVKSVCGLLTWALMSANIAIAGRVAG